MTRLRPATLEDAGLLLDWRNDPVSRRSFFDQREIGTPEHAAWLERTLRTPATPVWVAVDGSGAPVGSVRWVEFPAVAAGEAAPRWRRHAAVSLVVAPGCRGSGLGVQILRLAEALARERGVDVLNADVKADNVASLITFLRAGYRLAGTTECHLRLTPRAEDSTCTRGGA